MQKTDIWGHLGTSADIWTTSQVFSRTRREALLRQIVGSADHSPEVRAEVIATLAMIPQRETCCEKIPRLAHSTLTGPSVYQRLDKGNHCNAFWQIPLDLTSERYVITGGICPESL